MKYRRIVQHPRGDVELVEDELSDPQPGEVCVEIQAAGVSFADLLMREGVHPEARRQPFTPGWDVVGVVEKLGDGVKSVGAGDMVAAMPISTGVTRSVRSAA